MSDTILTEFEAVVHRVARVGEHVIDFVEGGTAVHVNGVPVTAPELEHFARAIYQAAVALGALAPIVAGSA